MDYYLLSNWGGEILKAIKPIGVIKNGYNEKFGIPRQSGLAESVISEIVINDEFNDINAFRGIEEYSHLWLIWDFSENGGDWSPTVRPPKLGGNKRVGVFATRSPFRPNGLGLSCVQFVKIENRNGRVVLTVSGADLKNNTPIYDIKPYIPYADCIENAVGSFADSHKNDYLDVIFSENIELNTEIKAEIREILSLDPRPQYQDDEDRIYGLSYKNYQVKFQYSTEKIIVLTVEKDEI